MSDIGTFKSKVKFDYVDDGETFLAGCRICPDAPRMSAASKDDLAALTAKHKALHWDQAVRNAENTPQPLERTA